MLLLLSATLVCGTDPLPPPKVDPDQSLTGKTSAAVDYVVDFKAIVTAPMGTKKLRVWIPVPPSDAAQTFIDGTWESFPTGQKPIFYTETVFGNRFAYFEFDSPQGAQIINHTFKATVKQMDWAVDETNVIAINQWPKSFDQYNRSESAILLDDRIRKLATEVGGEKPTPSAKLFSIMDWTNKTLTYDHSNTSLTGSTEHALTKKRGDCSDFHGVCSSFGRAVGVPTRIVKGWHLFAKNSPSHCKLEAYLPPHGWVSFDVSETQRLIGLIEAEKSLKAAEKQELVKAAVARMRRGFRDNTWLSHSVGTDYDVAPRASRKVPLISVLYAEADGVPLPEPDPADKTKKEFAWMTAHKFESKPAVTYPFRDWKSLKK